MSISAIVVSYRTGEVLKACVQGLLASAEMREIILVDNGNPPEMERYLDRMAAENSRLVVLRGQGNMGFASACNFGARLARSPRLLFVNPDAILERDAPQRLAQVLDGYADLAIIGGDLRDDAGRVEPASQRERLTFWRAFVTFTGLSVFGGLIPSLRDLHRSSERDDAKGDVIAVPVISGALFMMRKTDFTAIGGLDAGYFLHVEDIDLCRRVEDAGGQVLFARGPHGVHKRSSSNVPSGFVARHKAQSFRRYFQKFSRSPFEASCAELVGRTLSVFLPMKCALVHVVRAILNIARESTSMVLPHGKQIRAARPAIGDR